MISHQFIHVHIPRTGGSTIRGIIQQLSERGKVKLIDSPAHLTLRESWTVLGYEGTPSFAFTRNPFDWYVSSYHREVDAGGYNGTFEKWFRQTVIDKGETLTALWYHYTHPGVTHIGRYENYALDVSNILCRFIPTTSPQEIDELLHSVGRTRKSWSRKPYKYYYRGGDFIRDSIYMLDAWYMTKFGYDFGGNRPDLDFETTSLPWNKNEGL